MYKHSILFVAAILLLVGCCGAAPFGLGLSGSMGAWLQQPGGGDPGRLNGDADSVDGFHAYASPHSNALLALDAWHHFPVSVFENDSIPGAKLRPGGVTAGRLASNSVTTEKITDGQVMEEDLAAGAVTSSKIANGEVTSTKLAPLSVTEAKLASGAVTLGKLAENSVASGSIADGSIRGADIGIPLLMGGTRDGYLIGCFNASTDSSASGITGFSTAASGETRGVVGACLSPDGKGVYGVAKSATGYTYGVYGRVQSENGVGVCGYSTKPSGFTQGVMGYTMSTDGRGVWGFANSSSGSSTGVYGQSASTDGYGVYGSAQAGSGTTCGVYGKTYSNSGYGVYSNGDCYVDGDQTVTGTKTGYVSDIVLNGGDEPLYPGDLVEIVWHSEPVVGRIPVAVVRKTCEPSSKAVLGPIDSAVSVTDNEMQTVPGDPNRPGPSYHVKRADGAVLPGEYGRVVTLGLYEMVRVDASYGPIYPGDLLVSSPTPGCAMASDDPMVGTVVGKALSALESGIGEMPVFVSPR